MADRMAAECPVAAEEYTQSRNNLRANSSPYRLTRTHVFLEDEFIPRDSRGFMRIFLEGDRFKRTVQD